MAALKVATINVEGLNNEDKRIGFFKALIKGDYDIIAGPNSHSNEKSQKNNNIQNHLAPDLYPIMFGDFNMVEDPWIDKLGSRNTYSTTGINELNQIKSQFDLVDVWRSCNPQKLQFTWSSGDQSLQSRIDRIYVSDVLIPDNPISKILPFPWSDHDIVCTKVRTHIPQVLVPGNLILPSSR